MRPDNAFGRREQDALWERIKASLDSMRHHVVATPCEYYGRHQDWSEWMYYEKGERITGTTVFLVEKGEAQTCLTCGETVFRRVEWTLEDHQDAEPWTR